jgi:ribonuclease HII
MNSHKSLICGLDESGRGALAGPLVAAAVLLPADYKPVFRDLDVPLRDGKTLTGTKRRKIFEFIKKNNIRYRTETISVRIINNHGIGKSNLEIFRRLIKRIQADRYIVDGNLKIGKIRGRMNIESRPHADANIPVVIIAGIIAKYTRDKIMRKLHHDYPQYGWNSNAGYGTKRHIESIKHFGICRYHRNVYVTTAEKNAKKQFK